MKSDKLELKHNNIKHSFTKNRIFTYYLVQMKLFQSFLRFLCLLILSHQALAQDFEWWNNKHNWDGTTHWSRYIITSPKFLGPNALPVPEIKNGKISEDFNLKMAFERHSSQGDKTSNLFSNIFIPIQKNKVGLNIFVVPIEYYNLDTITRDERRARQRDAKGFAHGDIYFGTHIQVLEKHDFLPDILLNIAFRTASGSKLSDARYTDTPGYYFDVSAGKSYSINNSFIESVRPHLMMGFYVWQTYLTDYFQNDAFLYGIGVDLNFENFSISNAFGGYNGYINNGDNPNVYRFTLSSKLISRINYEIRFQQGFTDFKYSTLRVGCNINLAFKK